MLFLPQSRTVGNYFITRDIRRHLSPDFPEKFIADHKNKMQR